MNIQFLSRVSILTRDIDIASLSVCLSVCPSVRNVPVSDENGLTYPHSFFHHTVDQSFCSISIKHLHEILTGSYIHRVQEKKVPLIFLLYLLQILTNFHNFSCTTSQDNAKVIGVKIYHHIFVMLLPYRVKVSDTKVTHFTPILALCTCLYRSHLQKPVSTKQTKHIRKSEAQNLCSKCPPFMRTHAFKRLCHCAITAAMAVCMVQQPPLPQQTFCQLSTFFQLISWIYEW